MDYGVEVPSYRRIDNEKKTKKINFENEYKLINANL